MIRFKIKTRRGKLDSDKVRLVWGRFRTYTLRHRWALAGALAASLGVIAAQIAAPWPIKIIFDYILSDAVPESSWITRTFNAISSGPISALAWVCVGVLLIASADALFSYLRDILLAQTGQRVVGGIRKDLFGHLQTLSPADLESHHTGSLLTRLTSDIQLLRQMLVNAVITSTESVLLILMLVVVMFWLNPLLATVGIATIPITIWTSLRISRQIRHAADKQREKESAIAAVAHDVLGGLAIVQAFNREAIEQKRFVQQNRSSIRAGLKATRLESKLYRIVSLASAIAMCAILFLGVREVLTTAMTAGDLLVFISYLRAVNKPMRRAAKLAGQVAKASACGERVNQLFQITPSVCDRKDARPLSAMEGSVTFEDVTFGYEPVVPVLKHLSLNVRAGERVAIVGPTGAGKTTMVKLLLRFFDPNQGRVLVDGSDLRCVQLHSVRSQSGWVHQDTLLFGMSISENIALGKPEADTDEIRQVARRVHAHEFIEALPEGYETVLGQGGCTLSGGQRQRIALARALLRNPRILLLDEPATGLDPITRRCVEEAWMAPSNDATTIVICHRLHEMRRFHRIIVLIDGSIDEEGSHEELLRAGGIYASMHSISQHDEAATEEAAW